MRVGMLLGMINVSKNNNLIIILFFPLFLDKQEYGGTGQISADFTEATMKVPER